jgi:hypothetical protein
MLLTTLITIYSIREAISFSLLGSQFNQHLAKSAKFWSGIFQVNGSKDFQGRS